MIVNDSSMMLSVEISHVDASASSESLLFLDWKRLSVAFRGWKVVAASGICGQRGDGILVLHPIFHAWSNLVVNVRCFLSASWNAYFWLFLCWCCHFLQNGILK